MKITYDPYADAMYVYMQQKRKQVVRTEEVRPDLLLDIGKNGELLGIEILDISTKLPKTAATSLQVELNVIPHTRCCLRMRGVFRIFLRVRRALWAGMGHNCHQNGREKKKNSD